MAPPQHRVPLEEEVHPLAPGDPPGVEEVASKAAVAPEAVRVDPGGRVDGHRAHGVGAPGRDRVDRLQEGALLLGPVPEPVDRRHGASDGAKPQRCLVVSGGDQQARMRRRGDSPDGRVVEVGGEEGRPVGPGGQGANQPGGEGSLGHQPGRLRPERPREPEHRPADLVEEAGRPSRRHREAAHAHPPVDVVPGREGGRPGGLVARRGGPDLHLPAPPLEGDRQPPHQQLAAPAHAGAEARHHQPELPRGGAGMGRRSRAGGRMRPDPGFAAVRRWPGHTPTASRGAEVYQSARVSGIPDSPASPCRTARIWWTAIDPCSNPTWLPVM